jgi:hypothetical protein
MIIAMFLSRILLVVGLGVCKASAFAVFAHFMVRGSDFLSISKSIYFEPASIQLTYTQVGNTKNYNVNDWIADMNAAKAAGIDAFALSVAPSHHLTTCSRDVIGI